MCVNIIYRTSVARVALGQFGYDCVYIIYTNTLTHVSFGHRRYGTGHGNRRRLCIGLHVLRGAG